MIYFDSAATTLEKPASVSKAVAYAVRHYSSPGRGGYRPAMEAGEVLYRCREKAAKLFDVQTPDQVVLTSSATHGLNIAIRSLVKSGSTVVISGYEHNAVTRVLHSIPDVTVKIAVADLFDAEGVYHAFDREVTEDTDVVICNHVSNVFGFIQPVEQISELCKKRAKPLIIDASQSAGTLPLSMTGLGAAFIAMPGHKGLYGPQGTGLLLCGQEADPIIFGGTGSASIDQDMPDFLPDRLEAGTHNVCGAAGLLAGMNFVQQKGPLEILRHEQWLCRNMRHRLSNIQNIRIFEGENQAGLFSFVLDGTDCEDVGDFLAGQGIAVRTGVHCAPLAHKSAGTLDRGTVRVSFSVFNRMDQVEHAVSSIQKIAESGRAH